MGDFYYVVVYLCYLCLTFALPSLPRRESARVSPQPGCESGYSHPAHMTLSELTLTQTCSVKPAEPDQFLSAWPPLAAATGDPDHELIAV